MSTCGALRLPLAERSWRGSVVRKLGTLESDYWALEGKEKPQGRLPSLGGERKGANQQRKRGTPPQKFHDKKRLRQLRANQQPKHRVPSRREVTGEQRSGDPADNWHQRLHRPWRQADPLKGRPGQATRRAAAGDSARDA